MVHAYPRRSVGFVVALALAAAVALTGCSQPAQSTDTKAPAEKKVVQIGFAAPLTGDNAVYGQSMKRAVELAIKQANASEEAEKAGYEFKIFAQDDQGDPKQAVIVANLIESEQEVAALVGHFNSGCSIPASDVYERAGLAMVSVSSNPQLTAKGYKIVNRVVAKDNTQGKFAGDMVFKDLGLKKVAVIDDSTAYGEGLAQEFVKQFQADGGTVVVQDKVGAKDVDFAALVSKIKNLAPEAIYYGGAHTQGALLSKQAKSAGMAVPIIGGDMLFSEDYVKLAGAGNAEGDICTSLGLPLEQQPGGEEFKKAYVAEFGEEPGAYDSYSYDSANIIINAVLKAGPDRAKVAEAIRAQSFDGVSGSAKFDENGDTTNQAISAYKVQGGTWKQMPVK